MCYIKSHEIKSPHVVFPWFSARVVHLENLHELPGIFLVGQPEDLQNLIDLTD